MEKITKLAFKFLLAYCSLQSKQIDSSKRTEQPPPLPPSGNRRASTKAVQTARKPVLDSAAHKCWWMLILLGKQARHESVGEIYSWVELFFMGRGRGLFCNRFNIKLRSICVREFKLNRWVQQWIKAVPRRERNPLLMGNKDWGAEKGVQKGIGRQLKAHNSCLKWKGQLCCVFLASSR